MVSGGLVWVGTNNQNENDNLPDFSVLACYRESDGKLLSRYLSPRRGEGTKLDWPQQSLSGSPLAEGDRLWFCTNRREVVCLDIGPLKKGTGEPREVWKLDMVKDLKVHPRPLWFPTHDFLGSPAAYKDYIYVPTGNGKAENFRDVPAPDAPSLVCLRKDTGKVVWSDNSPGRNVLAGHSASPTVIEVGGRAQVIHPQADGWVRAFDAETGTLVWKLDCNPVGARGDRGLGNPGKRVYVMGTPVYAGGKVYFGTGIHAENAGSDPGRLFCVDPTKTGDVSPEVDDGTGKGKKNPNSAVVWEYTRDDPKNGFHLMTSSVAVHDGLVYAADHYGLVHCLDAKSGERYWWHDAKSHVSCHPLVVDGKVYVATEDGDVIVFAVGKTKNQLAVNEMNARVAAPPVFANGVLYILTDRHLHAIAAPPPAKAGTPDAGKKETPVGQIIWGKEVKGLQAGIGIRGDPKNYRIGEEVPLEVRVRNVGKEPVKIAYSSARLLHSRPEVADAAGKRLTAAGDNRLVMPPAPRYYIPIVDGVLKPGEEIVFAQVQLKLAPATTEGLAQTPELRAAPGVYSISYTVMLGTDLSPATPQLRLVVEKTKE